MAVHPLRPATDRRLGGPLPHQPANQTRVHLVPPEFFTLLHAKLCAYAVLAVVSNCCPPVQGRLPTRYSPVRRSVTIASIRRNPQKCFARLACVRHAASVHPEPGSNSHVKMVFVSCQFYLALFTVNSGSFFVFRLSCLFLNFSENLGIFRVALLFICQRSVILRCCCSQRQL